MKIYILSDIGGKICGRLLHVKHQKFIKIENTETELSKIVDKYAQLKRFHHYLRLQVYIYSSIYADPQTMPVEDHFLSTKIFVVKYKKMSTPETAPKHWLWFSYIHSEDYELDQKFNDK